MARKKNKIILDDELFDDLPEDDSEIESEEEETFLGLTDDEICDRIETEYTNAYEFRKPNINDWHENENILYGKKPKTLTKRSNIMIQLASGFEDTLLSKIKNPVMIVYKPQENADVAKARKVTKVWELESSVSHEDWEYKDLLVKKLAMTSGRGILKIYSDVPYSHRLDPIDHYDFLVDPLANGMTLESARYLGQDNIILSKWELENEALIKDKVDELISSYSDENYEIPDNQDLQKSNRYAVLGMNYSDYFQAGDPSYKLLEWYTTIKGTRCVFLLDLDKRIIIRKEKLEAITGILKRNQQPFWPFESWAYYPDLFNFWSPAPITRVREIFILRNVSLNQMFDNNEAKNKPMKSYDPLIYKDPTKLIYAPDKLIPVASGRDPQKGLYVHPVNSINDPAQFDQILEKLAGKITGVTSSGAGLSDTEKVGIYYGDQQEIEKRMTLFEISYNRAHLKLGQKYLKYLEERFDEESALKILGEDGIEKEDLTQDDLAEFDIVITGGLTQANNDALEKKAKNDFIKSQLGNKFLNQKFALELGMALNGFNKDDIKRATEPVDVDEKQTIRAADDVKKLLLGKKIKLFLKAEVTYMQKMFDYVYDNELSKKDEDKILAYLKDIQPIVLRNMVNKARTAMALKGMLQVPEGMLMNQPGDAPPEDPQSQFGIDQQKEQVIPSESQQTYDRA